MTKHVGEVGRMKVPRGVQGTWQQKEVVEHAKRGSVENSTLRLLFEYRLRSVSFWVLQIHCYLLEEAQTHTLCRTFKIYGIKVSFELHS